MFQAPKKLKFKRFHKIKVQSRVTENSLFCPKFGDYGLQAQTMGKLNAVQLEAGRLVVRRFSKKRAFLKINVYPYVPITKKPTAARMGKGKGKLAD
jgi:large subunit ribosomal protein L16